MSDEVLIEKVKYYRGEREPIAKNPILRGVDLAIDRLVRQDCFTDRTLRILDELRAEVIGGDELLRAQYSADQDGSNRDA